VYDNAEAQPFSNDFFPKAGQGAVLMTTRNANLSRVPGSADCEIQSFAAPAGVEFLLRLLHAHDSTRDVASPEAKSEALELSTQLGGHALASTQMAGLICSRHWSSRKCLRLYEDSPRAIHNALPGNTVNLDYKFFINTVFRDQLTGVKNSLAFTLLGILSFLVPDAIDQQLFEPSNSNLPSALQWRKCAVVAANQWSGAVTY
jgi:hypothetical protein